MGNIVLLDELTINKIAAGEVIERPASVIKEMVENAIDAGASNICVEIKNGGISYIRITDNGKGIEPDDMQMAFERHATSKIRVADDLETVKSMGFRGEALASIAAIAKVEMTSKTKEAEVGTHIVVEAGNIVQQEEIACQTGTTITVTNLFFNTPVRYKFLKKDFTEAGYIEDTMTRLALVNGSIGFKLVNSGKTVLQTTGNGEMTAVIYSIYGKDVAEAMIPVDYTYEDIHIQGSVGKPEIARSNRSYQLFFVNGRFVKDKTLAGAAEKGFQGMLPIGKHGFLTLNIEMAPNQVDVNVHPAKLEVRFEEEQKVFKAVYHAIKDTLLKTELVANTEKEKREDVVIPEIKPELDKESKWGGLFGRKMGSEGSTLTMNPEQAKIEIGQTVTVDTGEIRRAAEVSQTKPENLGLNNLIELQRKIQEELERSKKELQNKKEGLPKESAEENIEELLQQEPDKTIQVEVQSVQNTEEEQEYKKSELGVALEGLEQEEQQAEETQESEIQEQEPEQVEEKNDGIEDTKTIELKEMLEQLEEARILPDTANFDEMYFKMFGKLPPKEEETENTITQQDLSLPENLSVFEEAVEYKTKPTYQFIGIAFSTYIILQMEQDLYIMDQHAAHERIMYEKVKKNFYDEKEKDSQLMILPDIVTLTYKEMDIARDNLELFEKAGFMLEEFGENTIKIAGTPSICLELDTKELFLETLDEINTVARTAKQEIEEKFIATIACKAAVKAHMVLGKEEVESLLDQLLVLPNPFTCPHGRPTAIKMTKTDIEKKFARR